MRHTQFTRGVRHTQLAFRHFGMCWGSLLAHCYLHIVSDICSRPCMDYYLHNAYIITCTCVYSYLDIVELKGGLPPHHLHCMGPTFHIVFDNQQVTLIRASITFGPWMDFQPHLKKARCLGSRMHGLEDNCAHLQSKQNAGRRLLEWG